MNNIDNKKTISAAIIKLLKPLVSILLRNGIPYGSFAELAKWVYVDTAANGFGIEGKKQTDSRVSILTGLSRKEVRRVKETPEEMSEEYNRAARVISGWLKDPAFLDENNNPIALEIDSSFAELVKKYSGDIPVRALLDEMADAGVVECEEGSVTLLSRGYIVKKGDAAKMGILGNDVSELISTIKHNIEQPDAFLQRKAAYDNIPENYHQEVRAKISKMGEEFLESVDQLISQYDRDANPSVKGDGRKKLGLGIFYFE